MKALGFKKLILWALVGVGNVSAISGIALAANSVLAKHGYGIATQQRAAAVESLEKQPVVLTAVAPTQKTEAPKPTKKHRKSKKTSKSKTKVTTTSTSQAPQQTTPVQAPATPAQSPTPSSGSGGGGSNKTPSKTKEPTDVPDVNPPVDVGK